MRLRSWHASAPTRRPGKIFAMFAILLPILLGMMGLVIDGGLLISSYRQTQNAADAAALAAAQALSNGQSPSGAVSAYISSNGMNLAQSATVNNPPQSGAFANPPSPLSANNYVEVSLTNNVNVFFITLIPGIGNVQTVTARAVAGIEAVSGKPAVITLNPKPTSPNPGEGLHSNGTPDLITNAPVIIDSEGTGLGANGQPVQIGSYTQGPAANMIGNAKVQSPYIGVVGGVSNPNSFLAYNGTGPDTTLHTGILPVQDPLLTLPTPSTANGVVNTNFGNPSITNGNAKNLVAPNSKDPNTGVVTLNPGIYSSINMNGGTVVLNPGIYVLQGGSFSVNGNTNLTGNGVMIYMTGSDYSPTAGTPDKNDGSASPNPPPSTTFGSLNLNGTGSITLNAPTTGPFAGMVVYQRRWDTASDSMGGTGSFSVNGTVYARWADLTVYGTGNYNSKSQLITGTLTMKGNGSINIDTTGQKFGSTNHIFLVE